MSTTIKGQIEALVAELAHAQNELSKTVSEGFVLGQTLRDAAQEIGESSSGSWVGWHSRMYFGDFEVPTVAERWNSEWGESYGAPDRWHDNTNRQVQAAIEARAGHTIAELAGKADSVRIACEKLQQEILVVLSPVCDLFGFTKEATMLAELEEIKWITPAGAFVRAISPDGMMSRDSGAINEGMKAPLHLNSEGSIVSNTQTLETCDRFLKKSLRLARQSLSKLDAGGSVISEASNKTAPAEAPPTVTSARSNTRLESQLKRRSLALFALIALAIVIAAMAAIREIHGHAFAEACVIVFSAILVGGAYGHLVSREHAKRALIVAAAVGGAIATVQQLLPPGT